jgi:hypothetical protein
MSMVSGVSVQVSENSVLVAKLGAICRIRIILPNLETHLRGLSRAYAVKTRHLTPDTYM